MPFCTVTTGNPVLRLSSSVMALSWLGSRCGTRTKAIPGLGRKDLRSSVKASSPPAEAPTPTMGKLFAVSVCGAAALEDLPGLPGFLFDDLRLLLALAITFMANVTYAGSLTVFGKHYSPAYVIRL